MISNAEVSFTASSLKDAGVRADGRIPFEVRPLELKFLAEPGVVELSLGPTRVLARTSAELGPPFGDRASEGSKDDDDDGKGGMRSMTSFGWDMWNGVARTSSHRKRTSHGLLAFYSVCITLEQVPSVSISICPRCAQKMWSRANPRMPWLKPRD